MSQPIDKRDNSDPGDVILRKFKYQHAYGVILAVAMTTQTNELETIWCEQHEDFIAQRKDGKFEAYQVKTKDSSSGPWNISDEGF